MKISKEHLDDAEEYLSQFIKVGEAAQIMNVTRNTVYARARAGLLDTVPVFVGTSSAEAFFWRAQVEDLAEAEK
jgi:hypothetical protein